MKNSFGIMLEEKQEEILRHLCGLPSKHTFSSMSLVWLESHKSLEK